jgi:sulfite reductase (NADPH) hemoprotein beta-component
MSIASEQRAGRASLHFSRREEVDEFVDTLQRYESGEIDAAEWRRYRLLRGTYAQRQDGVQMLRVKVPQGVLTGEQLRVLAGVSERYSRGFAHITTRQNVQFHFVPLAQVPAAMDELADVGLTSREACGNSVRNVTGCPYAGTARDEVFDMTPYGERMTRYFLRHPLSGILPRKFKIAFEGCAEDHVLTGINDIGYRARIVGGRRGFRVTVAGSTSIMPVSGYVLYDFLPVEEMLNVAEAIVRVFRKYGDYEHKQRNRLKFVIRQIGWEQFHRHFEEELELFRQSGGAALEFDPDRAPAESAPSWCRRDPPTEDAIERMSSTPVAGPGIVPGSVGLTVLPDSYVRWQARNVSAQRQDGFCHVTVRLPLGDFTAGQLRVLADLSEAFGDGSVRLTVHQNVLMKWVPVDAIEPLYRRLIAARLDAPDAGTIADVVSCPGAESCRLAVTQSRGLARLLTEHLSARPDVVDRTHNGTIKISGCPNGCGQHHVGAIGFQGSVRKVAGRALPQYFVLVGGGPADDGQTYFGKVVAKVPVHRIPQALDRLLALYDQHRQSGEDVGGFFRRTGTNMAAEALKGLAGITPDEIQPTDLVDLGETGVFTPETMEGECAV